MSLIENLQHAELFDHPVTKFEVIETHISWVLLTGQYVYKIKKPVDFGFLNFSSLEKRHFYCEEEVRLNRRLAPDLYLGVVSICGSVEQPVVGGDGPVIEYAVKMLQFPQSMQLDRLLASQGLDNQLMDQLAKKVAEFHLAIDVASPDSEYGDVEHIRQPVMDNFKHIRASISDNNIDQLLDKLEFWTREQIEILKEIILQRKADGFVRECHGDMHLRNIARWKDEIIIFDCIEFNKNFFWIDVISEIAFLIMDLEDRQQQSLATRFLNSYLEMTGDYAGVILLQFYKVYRALVRAKVDALRTGQEKEGSPEYDQTYKDCLQYLRLAQHYTHPIAPCLLINHGLSGSGKSYISRLLLEKFPAIQVRSDVERKRIYKGRERSQNVDKLEQGIYSPEATKRTYAELTSIARQLLLAGYSVIIDAANLKQAQRSLFIELAKSLNTPYFILDYHASADTLRRRVKQRALQASDVSDATLEVLEHQMETFEEITETEIPFVIRIETDKDIDINSIVDQIQAYIIKF